MLAKRLLEPAIEENIDASQFNRHPGEEFVYVVSGSVEIITKHYEATALEPATFIVDGAPS